jgi:hypothetical protein
MMLGNFSVEKMEERLNVQFPQECRDFLNASRQEMANDIVPGKWHCFDIPFHIVFGDEAMCRKVHEWLKPLSDKMTGSIAMSWMNHTDK